MPTASSRTRLGQVLDAVDAALDSKSVPKELLDALSLSVESLTTDYMAQRLRPAELNAGDFTEAMARVLQFLATGKYTALGKTLPKMNSFLQQMESSNLDDALRIHVPRALQSIYDVRNRRGVGHLAGGVSPNRPDAELVVVVTRWILAEIVRLYHGTDHQEAQRIVDILAIHEAPIVEDFEGLRRVISANTITVSEQVLILLVTSDVRTLPGNELRRSIRSSSSAISVSISRLVKKNLVHVYEDKRITLTSLGYAKALQTVAQLSK